MALRPLGLLATVLIVGVACDDPAEKALPKPAAPVPAPAPVVELPKSNPTATTGAIVGTGVLSVQSSAFNFGHVRVKAQKDRAIVEGKLFGTGAFVFDNLSPGVYRVFVEGAYDDLFTEEAVTVRAGEESRVTLLNGALAKHGPGGLPGHAPFWPTRRAGEDGGR